MKKIPADYIERLYAAWYGKAIGVRYGAPIEGWTAKAIEKIYGELDGYPVKYQKNFAADDDTNGPIFFLRALEDYGLEATAADIGKTWRNYALEGKGFFWWGGYGKSTEHTAYLNLKQGIAAPRSGSIAQNGTAVAEQIGGQIFIDSWGMIAPGQPEVAAAYAEKAASVSHDGNGIYGALFVAAAISIAFVERDIYRVIQQALAFVPKDSAYMRMAKDVLDFHREHPGNWREGFAFVFENYGYDRYPGACHIIPNSAVMLLSMLYGGGDFDKTLNICNMCGWDTDCNAGNVGCIMGTLVGLEGINYQKWIQPINDFLCCSSAVGSLNQRDIPWCTQYVAQFAYRIAKEQPPEKWESFINGTAPDCHFDLPGSTHAFRARFSEEQGQVYSIRNTTEQVYAGQGALAFFTNKMSRDGEAFLYIKTYYTPEDFHDSRYDPAFSPTVYPGETVSCAVAAPADMAGRVQARLYARDCHTGEMLYGDSVVLEDTAWHLLAYHIPGGTNVLVSEVGVALSPCAGEGWQDCLRVFLDSFSVSGNADFKIDFEKETEEVWHGFHKEISQFTTAKGIWELGEGCLGVHCDDYAEAYCGRYDFQDYGFSGVMLPQLGAQHRLNFRVQGVMRSYAVALQGENKLTLLKNENGYHTLLEMDFPWECGGSYAFEIQVCGNQITVAQNGKQLMAYRDENNPYLKGQVGLSVENGSCCKFREFKLQPL